MTAKQLKNSILKEAVQGKLVSQNKEDEPSSELLKRIKAERDKLINAGKIKPNKNISSIYRKGNSFYEKKGKDEICIDAELPFEIPKSWEWAYFKDIVFYSMGKTPPRKEKEYWEDSEFAWVSIADIVANGFIYETKEKVNQYSVDKIFRNKISVAGTLLMSFKLTVGKVSILGIDAYHNEGIISIYPLINDNNIMRDYLFFILPLISQYGNTKSAIKGNTLNSDSLDLLYIPIPPIEEQKRIVNKLNELMPLIEEYEKLESELNELDKKFPERLKKSILKEAIQGKLVIQNKKDEPSSELLKRIKSERDKLIKAGKIKPSKNISSIYRKGNSFYEKKGKDEICIDAELPFEIPKSWEWTKLSFVSDMFTGNSINENEKNLKYKGLTEGYFYIATKDVNFNNEINYNNGVRIPKDADKFRIAPKNSILFCVEGGSAGKKIALTDKEICFGNKLCCFISYGIDIKYLYYYLQNPIFIYSFKRNTTGIIGGVSINTLKQMFLPIPPIEEQKRIVEKLDKLMELCEELKRG